MVGSTCFGHCYAHHQELRTIVLITTRAVRFLGYCWLEVKCRQAGWISVPAVGYMFRALLFPTSGAHNYSADYHMDHPVLGLLLVGSWVQAIACT